MTHGNCIPIKKYTQHAQGRNQAHSMHRVVIKRTSLAMKPLRIDGTTGEGGGQLVRVACGLAALTSTPVTITNVRGNREGGRGGGRSTFLKLI